MCLLHVNQALGRRQCQRSSNTDLLAGVLIGVPSDVEVQAAIFVQELVGAVDFDATLETDQVDVHVNFGVGSGQTGVDLGLGALIPHQREFDSRHGTSTVEEFTVNGQLRLTGPFDLVAGGHGHVTGVLETVANPVVIKQDKFGREIR